MNYNSCGDIQNTLAELDKRPDQCSSGLAAEDMSPIVKPLNIFSLGATLTRSSSPPAKDVRQSLADQQPSVPEEFDWTKQTKVKAHMEGNLINQGRCGSCWAIATATSLGDRYVVALSGQGYKILKPLSASVVLLLSCDCLMPQNPMGTPATICKGGNVESALLTLQSDKLEVATEKCFPYPQKLMQNQSLSAEDPNISWKPDTVGDGTMACINFKNPSVQGCQTGKKCGESLVKLSVSKTSNIHTYPDQSYIIDLKRDIYKNGPIPTSFMVNDGFLYFWKSQDTEGAESYKENEDWKNTQDFRGGHAVVIVGWTKDSWIIRNSWGPTHRGSWYCKVKLDNDVGVGAGSSLQALGIGSYGGAVSFLPDLSSEKVQALIDTGYIQKTSSIPDLGEPKPGGPKKNVQEKYHNFWIVGGVLALVVVAVVVAIVTTRKNKKRGRRK